MNQVTKLLIKQGLKNVNDNIDNIIKAKNEIPLIEDETDIILSFFLVDKEIHGALFTTNDQNHIKRIILESPLNEFIINLLSSQ